MSSYKRILSHLYKQRYLALLPVLSIALTVGLDLYNPYFSRILIDKVIIGKQTKLLTGILITLISINAIRGILMYLRSYYLEMVSENTVLDLKYDLFRHIQSMPFKFFDDMETGELMSRMTNDIDNIKAVIAYGASIFIECIVYLISATILLLNISVKLTLLSIVALPFVAYLAFRFEKLIDRIYGKISDQAAKLNSTAEQNIAGMRVVHAFGRWNYEREKFRKENKSFLDLNIEETEIWAKYIPMMDFLSGLSVIIMLYVGGLMVIKKTITIGELVAFNGYIWMLIWPVRNMGWLVNMMAQAKASAGKIMSIFNAKPEVADAKDSIAVENIRGHVVFKDVSYKREGQTILEKINIDAKPGSKIAIMGTTGSGKTSIVNLIGRYYELTSGEITIDGINIKDMSLRNLRSCIGIVMQDTFLFSDTIAANIAFGKPDATMEEIIKAAKIARAHDFIMSMPEGYDTVVGERGVGLSGGQKQRIAIARAILKDPKILILDDATSAVDMHTEKEIIEALSNVMKGRTTFIIAHRVSSVKDADEIIMLENGRIVERGNHRELIDKKGKYFSLYTQQYKVFEFIDEEAI
ncbi:ATP-binding cassette, subfamily B [Caldanaerobius fijiensis DSM 17918]|uniref:ATP-binding cassette, subfamily B n=1 Tax=Caldanaerobius fijiensis DSM 17918 TaxID=1121256 RepID=A0A1M4ZCM9_9THEO|nr:ABC transporter ATP-binding protein [Caldanaerobius fijiensis]SHF15771.1 ATP-binding cassette, subfamily B [Caldanaerobius fijiensis DSM 17918]